MSASIRDAVTETIKKDVRKTVKLEDIVEIQLGYQQRERRHKDPSTRDGTHSLIQIKDIDSTGNLLTENLIQISPASNVDRYLVTKDDVLFLSRGLNNAAIIIEAPLHKTLAAYYFYILRADPKRILPEYLAWFINQPTAQAYFESAGQGSMVKMVPKSIFEELEVQLPPLKTQKAIAELNALQKKEAAALECLVRSRKRLINGLSLKAATMESKRQ